MSEHPPPATGDRRALLALLLAFAAIFGFIMPMVYVPDFYAIPVAGTVITLGVIGGMLLMCFLVGLAAVYTHRGNKAGRQ